MTAGYPSALDNARARGRGSGSGSGSGTLAGSGSGSGSATAVVAVRESARRVDLARARPRLGWTALDWRPSPARRTHAHLQQEGPVPMCRCRPHALPGRMFGARGSPMLLITVELHFRTTGTVYCSVRARDHVQHAPRARPPAPPRRSPGRRTASRRARAPA